MCARNGGDASGGASKATVAVFDRLTATRAAVAGAAAFVAVYAAAFVLWQVYERPDPRSVSGVFALVILGELRETAPAWKAAGHVVFNAQFVDSTNVVSVDSLNLVATGRNTLLALAYGAPPLALAAAGYAVASTTQARGVGRAATAGALVVVGYLPFVVAGAFLFPIDGANVWADIPVAEAVLLAGVTYPVLFGAASGTITRIR